MSEQPATADLGTRVIEIIAKTQRIPLESISLDSTFEQLKIDSLDGINIVFALEISDIAAPAMIGESRILNHG